MPFYTGFNVIYSKTCTDCAAYYFPIFGPVLSSVELKSTHFYLHLVLHYINAFLQVKSSLFGSEGAMSFVSSLECEATHTRVYFSCLINPFKPNGISHFYQFGPVHLNLRVVGWYFFIFIQILIEHTVSIAANSGGTDKMPPSVASDLSLNCLPTMCVPQIRTQGISFYYHTFYKTLR